MTIYKSSVRLVNVVKSSVQIAKPLKLTSTVVIPKINVGIALDVNIITANATLIVS